MTASSALPPCRVPAIATSRYQLSRLSGGGVDTTTANALPTTVRRRPVLPPKSVCRSLFGPPDPVETQKMLQEEDQRIRREFREKYTFEIDVLSQEGAARTSEKPIEDAPLKPSSQTVVVAAPPALPSLIEIEMQKHEQKKCNLRLVKQPPTITSASKKSSLSSKPSGATKRNQPQMLLKESFKIRRTAPHIDLTPSAIGRASN